MATPHLTHILCPAVSFVDKNKELNPASESRGGSTSSGISTGNITAPLALTLAGELVYTELLAWTRSPRMVSKRARDLPGPYESQHK